MSEETYALVVDDEVLIRAVLSRGLEMMMVVNHIVCLGSTKELEMWLASNPGKEVVVAFVDQDLKDGTTPGSAALILLEASCLLGKPKRIVCMSGESKGEFFQRAVEMGAQFLEKPWTPYDLSGCVAKAFER